MKNHDSKCPRFPLLLTERCWFCELIARVREDERTYAKQTSTAIMAYDEGRKDGYAAALRDAVEAVDKVAADMANWSSSETADALKTFPELTFEQWIWAQRGVYRSIAAIEALGEER